MQAEYALASANMIARKPHRLSHIEAASVPVVAVTAWQMLFDYAQVVAGQAVLILMISTLRKTAEAMGKSLSLVAEFPDRNPLVLCGIAEEDLCNKPKGINEPTGFWDLGTRQGS